MKFKLYLATALFFLFSFSQVQAQRQTGISEAAAKQIQSLIAEKESRTPVQQKIDSRLLYALKMEKGEPITPLVPTLEVGIQAGADGLLLLDIKGNVTNELLQAIKNKGGRITFSSVVFNSITVKAALRNVEDIAALPGVRFIAPAGQAQHAGKLTSSTELPVGNVDQSNKYNEIIAKWSWLGPKFIARAGKIKIQVENAIKGNTSPTGTGFTGSVNSQGDVTHKANLARSFFGVDGTGIKIAVQSDGLGGLANSQATGNLGNVTVLPGMAGPSGSEGTAMLEIVHDLAPGADLYFASAFNGQASFAQNILDLRAAGCDIICDDVFYYDENVFQDDDVARAVNTVTASGALYFSSAGNQGNLTDNTASVWEGDFVDGGASTLPAITGGTINDFGGTLYNTLKASTKFLYLFWSDPMGGATNDYDLFVLNAAGTAVTYSSTNVQNGTQDPKESYASNTALATNSRIVILKKTGSAARAFHLNAFGSGMNFKTQGQTHGHSSAINAYSVAATPAVSPGPYPGVFVTTNKSETFSSDGPRRMFFNPDGSPITAGNFLFATNGGNVRQKPDITAADGVSTTLPPSSGLNPFYGTSAAAPHAAAIAALVKQAQPTYTASQIRSALTSTAVDIEDPGVDRTTGAGIVMAYEAIAATGAVPIAVVTSSGSSLVTESCSTNGVIDPNETVTVSFCVKNIGAVNTTNLVGTLLATGGITAPSAPQTYGVTTAGGAAVCKNFTFTASGTCGGNITASIQLQDGAKNLGTLTYNFSLGTTTISYTQNFDALAAPALPAGWVTSQPTNAGGTPAWVTSGSGTPAPAFLSSPNSLYSQDPATALDNIITTEAIPVANATSKLSFSHNYNLEYGYDGGVIEISIPGVAGGAFQDILTAGGSFATGGYSGTISATDGSIIAGRSAWTGADGGFQPVIINLPATASGKSVQFRFRMASDAGTAGTGWRIDNIAIIDGYSCCTAAVVPTAIVATSGTPQSTVISTNFTTALKATVTGAGSAPVSGATVTFTAPGSGASGTFPGASLTATAVTDGSGVATAPTFTANATVGGPYNVAATVTGVATPANFALTNLAVPACTLTCPANIVVNNTAGMCGAIVNYPAPTTSGGCGTVTGTPAAGSLFPLGVTTVNVSSTTGATCSFTVTVSDNEAPVVTCPANITTNTAAGVCTADAATPNPVTSDNCSVTKLTWALTGATTGASATTGINNVGTKTFNKGVTTVTYTVTDASNNSATCSYTVTVNDNQAPTVTCPANITANTAAGLCSASVVTPNPTTADNCGAIAKLTWALTGVTTGASATTGINNVGTATFNKGVTTVTYTATDAAGNTGTCSYTVTVSDNEAPVITCPANISAATSGGICTAAVTFAAPTATDNCGGTITITSTPASGSSFPIGVTTVTSTATDAAGNVKTCSFTVTVTDGQPAAITTQPVNATGCAGQNVSFTVVATNAVSYQWQVNGGTGFTNIAGATGATLTLTNITFLTNGYQYRVVVTGPCSTTTSAAATLTVKAAPAVVLTAASYSSINPSVPAVLYTTVSPVGSYTYKWVRNGAVLTGVTGTSLQASVDLLGTYQVTVTDNTSGCSTLSNIVTVKDSASGRLFVYPNPNKGNFQVRFYNAGGATTARTLNVYDSKGARVFTRTYATAAVYERMDVNISNYASGTYMIEVRDAGGKQLAAAKVKKQ